jgi:hypothetical protein
MTLAILWVQTRRITSSPSARPHDLHAGASLHPRLRCRDYASCSSEPSTHRIEARFFAVPTSRHSEGTGHLPTQPYTLSERELTFGLCIRNAETDETVERNARVVFGGDEYQPRLTFWKDPNR